MVLNIKLVNVVVYLRKVDNTIRVSLRGKSKIDLSKVAQNFNGGGHKNAAGFTIEAETIKEVKGRVLNYFKNHTFC